MEREVAVANGFVGLHQVGSLWRVWRPHSIRTYLTALCQLNIRTFPPTQGKKIQTFP